MEAGSLMRTGAIDHHHRRPTPTNHYDENHTKSNIMFNSGEMKMSQDAPIIHNTDRQMTERRTTGQVVP